MGEGEGQAPFFCPNAGLGLATCRAYQGALSGRNGGPAAGEQRSEMIMGRLGFLLGVAILALAALGSAVRAQQSQDLRPLMDRLDRLERDMNLLQRQVYRGSSSGGGPVPVTPPGDAGAGALNFEVRLSQLEDQVRTLNGRIEETTYKVDQLSQRLDKLTSDMDFRLSQLEHGGAAGSTQAGAGPLAGAPQAGEGPRGRPAPLRPPGAGADPSAPASQSGTLGPIPAPGDGDSGAPTSDDQVASAPATAAPSNGSPLEQYNYAFGLLRQSKYDEAAQALRAFVKRNSKDPLAGNAQYWLGETYYVRKDYQSAAAAFADGYEKYPKSPKAADALLKLGMSLGNLGQKDNACRAYARLDRDFPAASAEIKDRSGAEKKRLSCAG